MFDQTNSSSFENDVVNLLIVSFNVGNKQINNLKKLLQVDNKNQPYNLIAIGLQEAFYEVEDKAALRRSKSRIQEEAEKFQNKKSFSTALIDTVSDFSPLPVLIEIQDALGPEFYQVAINKRAEMYLFVFARVELKDKITNVDMFAENTGFFHVMPNKGGLCVSMSVGGTSFAFISCHITPHEGRKNCRKRNSSLEEIFGGLRAGDKRFDVSTQFHHTFLFGDLNYRLSLENNQCTELEEEDDDDNLYNVDETSLLENNMNTTTTPGSYKATPTIRDRLRGDSDDASDTESVLDDNGIGGEGTVTNSNRKLDKNMEENENRKSFQNILIQRSLTIDVDDEDVKLDDVQMSFGAAEEDEVEDTKNSTDIIFPEGMTEARKDHFRMVFQYIDSADWESLLQHDELIREIAANHVLVGFTSLTPHFPPTFKRKKKLALIIEPPSATAITTITTTSPTSTSPTSTATSNAYSNRDSLQIITPKSTSSKHTSGKFFVHNRKYSNSETNQTHHHRVTSSKYGTGELSAIGYNSIYHPEKYYNLKRIPSYCDRIVYKSLPGFVNCLHNLYFQSCEFVTSSDHKPVRALFEIRIITQPPVEVMRNELEVAKSSSMRNFTFSRTPSQQQRRSTLLPSLQFEISRLRGAKLTAMDTTTLFGESSDPYVLIVTDPPNLLSAQSKRVKSTVIKKTLNPVWRDTLDFRVSTTDMAYLASSCHLLLTVWDQDVAKSDDLIGVVVISFRDILAATSPTAITTTTPPSSTYIANSNTGTTQDATTPSKPMTPTAAPGHTPKSLRSTTTTTATTSYAFSLPVLQNGLTQGILSGEIKLRSTGGGGGGGSDRMFLRHDLSQHIPHSPQGAAHCCILS